MTHPLAIPQRADVDVLRDAFDSGRSIVRTEVWDRYRINDRRFRAAVSALRHEGYPIVTESSVGACYRRARTYAEVREFVAGEVLSRARQLESQARAMLDRAATEFGDAQQQELPL